VAARLRVPYPILLVLGGAALGFIPGLPAIQVDPEAVFLIFVPPLVFVAAFFTSWRDFVAWRRPIFSLAVGLVLASTLAIAAVTHAALGIAWAPAFVLGAVVSNTDTTAIVAIAQQVGLPRRIVTVLEGESLVNDAMSLTAFRIAVVATVTGTFSLLEVGGEFALAVLGAIPVGLGIGWLSAAARRRADDPRIVIVISVLTPYAAYLPADQIGASGILSVVVAGLYVGRREARIEDAPTRLQARAVWDMFVFGLNGLLFILVGVQLRPIWDALRGYELRQVVAAAVAICLTVILTRIVWVFFSAVLSQVTRRPGAPPHGMSWAEVAVVAWSGLRGGDTLAAALSVPLVTASGAPFPARAEILFLAFMVIVVTLVGQGLTLPWLIRRLHVASDESEAQEERLARRAAVAAALGRLDELAQQDARAADLVETLRRRYAHQADLLDESDGPAQTSRHVALHERLQREVLAAQQAEVVRLRDEGQISDQVMRRVQRDLDLEQLRVEP
jgi:CPA1 family monovalent cation:H+ antiporter